MTDIAVRPDQYGRYDAAIQCGDFVQDNSLRDAVLVCLLTDAQATPEQLAEFGMDPDDARGWWGDTLNDDPTQSWGSLLWLLQRQPVTPQMLPTAKAFAEDALAILVDLGAASVVLATPSIDDADELIIPVVITKPDGSTENYQFSKLWQENNVDPFATAPVGQVTGLEATAGIDQAALSWDPLPGTEYYTVLYGTTEGAEDQSFNVAGTTVTLTSLSGGTPYYFIVQAMDCGSAIGVSGEVSATPIGGYDTTVRADSPWGYWRCGDLTGTVATDSSGHGRDAAYVDTVTLGVASLITHNGGNLAMSTAGDGYISLASLEYGEVFGTGEFPTPFSIEAWIQIAALPESGQGYVIYANGAAPIHDGGNLVLEVWNDGHIYIVHEGGDVILESTGTISLDTPHHIVMTNDISGSGLTCIYIDGALDSSVSEQAEGLFVYGTEQPAFGVTIDADPEKNMVGTLDECALYTAALTADQVQAHWLAGST